MMLNFNTYQYLKILQLANILDMRKLLVALILITLLISASCRKKKITNEQVQAKDDKKTVVEANHFYSNYQTSTNYNMNSVQKGKSLVYYLKPHNDKANDKSLSQNPITITLEAGSDKQTCVFNSYSQLCQILNVTDPNVKLKIQCKKTPCELSWLIVQPAVQEDDGDHNMDQLVAVNQESSHGYLKVVCSNPKIKDTFGSDLQLFTNSKYQKIITKMGAAYFLFNNEQKGYYYLTSSSQEVRNCANATLQHVKQIIDFNDKKQIMDFISKENPNTYQFKTMPDSDFRVQFSAHDVTFAKLDNTTGISVSLVGYKGGQEKVLSSISFQVDDQKSYIDFNTVFKKPAQKYDKMEFNIRASGNLLIFQSRYILGDVQEVQFGEQSYFVLQKGQKIKYKILPLSAENSKGINKMNIFVDGKQFTSSKTSCETTGCEFEISAIEAGKGGIYIGQSETQNKTEIIVLPFDKTVTKKIRQGQQLYYSHVIKAKSAVQMLINSINVMVYAASKTKCPVLDEQKCYQKVFNSRSPSIYESQKEDTLQFKIIALDNAQFTLTILDYSSKFVEIKDSIPFAYLFDDEEKDLQFVFNIPDKMDVSFNLIGPANQLDLLVLNKQKPQSISQSQDKQVAVDGYVKFQKSDLQAKSFYIKVAKKEQYIKNYIHFTLIATTKSGNLRLQPGSPHYENFNTNQKKDFVFEFVPKTDIFLNFYTHNIKQGINMQLNISKVDKYDDPENTVQFIIDKQVDVLNLALVSKKLCKTQDDNCQLFLRIQNLMPTEADVTITLMLKESVIELKDGIWQDYNINLASISAHFFYVPNHQKHSTTIYYKSTVVDLKIMYNLWKSDDKSMDPSQWPFPEEFKQNEKLSELTFKPLHYIHIEPAEIKKCWPSCVVLLSISPDVKSFKQGKSTPSLGEEFKIMASNQFIQLPEKHKIDIALVKGQNKNILVDLKYHDSKQQIEFYTYINLGYPVLKANVYSESNPRCPTTEEQADFLFTGTQTSLSLESIKAKMSENSIEINNGGYLCILASTDSDSKFTIEFNSEADSMKRLSIDTTNPIVLNKGEKDIFQIQANQELYLKISRTQGFPFFDKILCKPNQKKDVSKCVEDFKNSEEKGIQLADKVTTYDSQFCFKCILLIRLTAAQAAKFDIHVQSKYAEIELSENNPLSDSLAPNEENRYSLTGTKNEQIVINIQIISGNLIVEAHDFQQIDLKKSNPSGSKNIHIVIPSKDLTKKSKQLGSTYMTNYGLSSFVNLHLIITSQNIKQSAIYTITYSSGDIQVYLQDGLISQYNLVAHKVTKFIYLNPSNGAIYLHASTPDVQALNKLSTKVFVMGNENDEDQAVAIEPQKPKFNKSTPNPTILSKLPPYKTYIFNITNGADKDTLFSIGVNNREIMYLPFDHEFPIELTAAQYIYIVVNTIAAGYVKFSFSKCDESYPILGYTLDYNEFVTEDYQTEEQMTDQLTSQLVIKVKEAGGVYLKIRSTDFDRTLMVIKATFSPNKIVSSRSKPGDKGLIQYQILDSTKAQLTLAALVCTASDKNCAKDFTYTSVSTDKIQNLFAQLVCPSVSFSLPGTDKLKQAVVTNISNSAKNNKITFNQAIKGETEWVGVKAVNTKTGEVIYYKPVQIVTFWGQIHRSSNLTLIVGIVMLLLFVCGGLMIYRRYKKGKQYSQLGDENEGY